MINLLKEKALIIIWLCAFVLIGIFLKMYIFEIYEVKAQISQEAVTVGDIQEISISVLALNAFGFQAPLRNVPATLEITSGADIVTVTVNEDYKGSFRLKTGWKAGTCEIKITSRYSLFPMLLTLIVHQAVA